jgi:hypothetical protein
MKLSRLRPKASLRRITQESRCVVVERVLRANIRQRLSLFTPSSSLQLPTPEPTPADAVSAALASATALTSVSSLPASVSISETAEKKHSCFLAVPSALSHAHARTHLVPTPRNPGMLSTVSLASTSSEILSAGSLTDDAGTSSSSDDEARSPLNDVSPSEPRPRAAFLFLLDASVWTRRSRHASASTITRSVYAAQNASSSSESIVCPREPLQRSHDERSIRTRRSSVACMLVGPSASSLHYRRWQARRAPSTVSGVETRPPTRLQTQRRFSSAMCMSSSPARRAILGRKRSLTVLIPSVLGPRAGVSFLLLLLFVCVRRDFLTAIGSMSSSCKLVQYSWR